MTTISKHGTKNPVYGTEKGDYDNEREAACEPANEYFVRHWGLYKVPPKRTVMRKDCISLTLWPQKLASCLHHLDTFPIPMHSTSSLLRPSFPRN